ncbi:hypothetical protein DBV15_04434 [Temnothorax longispinosus]|uniref:Uncharacterized protein n=1 Tax=Temnothorax longispinosus TaxID=300112 RepID=A0A4S2KDD4_9HYME|nr:hypothetical protein DBV15_04434 [Temnothorax longispinosus]
MIRRFLRGCQSSVLISVASPDLCVNLNRDRIMLLCRNVNAIRLCAFKDSWQFARWFTILNPSSFTVALGSNEALSPPCHGSRTKLRNFPRH